MAIRIVVDYPGDSARRRARHGVRLAGGTALLVVGLATVPTVVVWSKLRPSAATTGTSDRTPGALVLLVLLISVTCTLAGTRVIRGRRNLILFLRRFGYTD